jgi:hypothetical protein
MTIEISAAVRGHLRNAVKYTLIAHPDAAADELTACLLKEIGDHAETLCRERDEREDEILHLRGLTA